MGLRMKTLFLPLFVAVFASIALFGLAGVLCVSGGSHCCLAETVQGVDCPSSDPVAFLNFHFNGFREFSAVTSVSDALSILIAAIASLALVVLLHALLPLEHALTARAFDHPKKKYLFLVFLERNFRRWLALLDALDSHPFSRVYGALAPAIAGADSSAF